MVKDRVELVTCQSPDGRRGLVVCPAPSRANAFVCVVALGFLWFIVIRHLAVEWSLNPQYAYGWAVPFLSLFLCWRAVKVEGRRLLEGDDNYLNPKELSLIALLAVSFAPARLIEEANPDWRLISWLLALQVTGLSVLLIRPLVKFRVASFPVFFFLVAVPWPTVFEAPVIRFLTVAVTNATAEILDWAEVPCLFHGNTIETVSGSLSVGDACSGIRSCQATLMLSLFFGELYRLTALARVFCIGAGLVASFCLNVLRTAGLALITAREGQGSVAAWHDLLGVPILIGCFIGIWLAAWKLRSLHSASFRLDRPAAVSQSNSSSLFGGVRANNSGRRLGLVLLLVWLGIVELGTRAWYRLHEEKLPAAVRWKVQVPGEWAQVRELKVPAAARQILRFDECLSVGWADEGGLQWQALFVSWSGGRSAARLARNHTPADCLLAAGDEVVGQSGVEIITIQGLDLPFRSYVARTGKGSVQVFYCLWEDRAWRRGFDASRLTYRERIRSVLEGRRNSGQRSLEVVLWGALDPVEARRALEQVLTRIIRVAT